MGYSNKTWACPFFKWDERQSVHCEGGRISFPDQQAAGEYTGKFCADLNGWERCPIAATLLRYYERTEKQ